MADAPVFNIHIDQAKLAELWEILGPNNFRRAATGAINKTIATGKAKITDRIFATLNVKRKAISDVITLKRATQAELEGKITITGKSIRITDYKGVKLGGGGVTAQFRLDRPPLQFKHAFQAIMKANGGSHTGIFFRTTHLPTKGPNMGKGKLTPQGFAGRLSISELRGPSVLSMLQTSSASGAGLATAIAEEEIAKLGVVLEKNIASQVDRFLERKKGDG
jgi:hypothetical protein